MTGPNALRQSWLVQISPFVATKRTNMYEGNLQSSTPPGKPHLPFLGSIPIYWDISHHYNLWDVNGKTCERRTMENGTSIFWAFTVYHISGNGYGPGSGLIRTVITIADTHRASWALGWVLSYLVLTQTLQGRCFCELHFPMWEVSNLHKVTKLARDRGKIQAQPFSHVFGPRGNKKWPCLWRAHA